MKSEYVFPGAITIAILIFAAVSVIWGGYAHVPKAEYEQLKSDAAYGRTAIEREQRHKDFPSLFDKCGNPLPPK